jgi:hypothetical protein
MRRHLLIGFLKSPFRKALLLPDLFSISPQAKLYSMKTHQENVGNTSREFWALNRATFLWQTLGREQFDLCLNELIRNDSLYVSGRSGAMLLCGVEISKWRIKGEESPTKSHVGIYYGAKPRISTFLGFRDIEEFRFIDQVLQELGLCRLDEKYLKIKKK